MSSVLHHYKSASPHINSQAQLDQGPHDILSQEDFRCHTQLPLTLPGELMDCFSLPKSFPNRCPVAEEDGVYSIRDDIHPQPTTSAPQICSQARLFSHKHLLLRGLNKG